MPALAPSVKPFTTLSFCQKLLICILPQPYLLVTEQFLCPALITLLISTFIERGSTLHALFHRVPVESGAGHFTGMLYGYLSMHV